MNSDSVQYVFHGIMLDDIVFPDGKTQMGVLGGGGPQAAWGAAVAIGDGRKIGIIGGVNHDIQDEALIPLSAAGVNLDGIHRNDYPTARAWQVLEWNGLRRHIWRVPMHTLPIQLKRGWDVAPGNYRTAEWFHWGIHPDDANQDMQWVQQLIENGIEVCLEPFQPSNIPMSLDEVRRITKPIQIYSVNVYEATKTAGLPDNTELLRFYRDAGCKYLLIRRDENGADVWDLANGDGFHVPAVKTTVVDVVGAGNAFTGAFMATLTNGIEDAACFASATASYMIEQVGIPLQPPTREDFQRRVAEAKSGLIQLTLE